jgi:hypothetical protein
MVAFLYCLTIDFYCNYEKLTDKLLESQISDSES